MKVRWWCLILVVGGSCASTGRHAELSTAPDGWVTTLDEPSVRVVSLPTLAPAPRATPRETCTLVQKLAMRISGMTEDQITKACE
jgi:hypothetical protein